VAEFTCAGCDPVFTKGYGHPCAAAYLTVRPCILYDNGPEHILKPEKYSKTRTKKKLN